MIPIKFFPLFLFEVPLGKKHKKTRLLMRYLQTIHYTFHLWCDKFRTSQTQPSRGNHYGSHPV